MEQSATGKGLSVCTWQLQRRAVTFFSMPAGSGIFMRNLAARRFFGGQGERSRPPRAGHGCVVEKEIGQLCFGAAGGGLPCVLKVTRQAAIRILFAAAH
jgi:hypothetical protein